MIVASDNFLRAKIINIRANFTRMFRKEVEAIPDDINKKGANYGKMIKQDDWVANKTILGQSDPNDMRQQGDVQIRVRGSEGHSIFIEISYNRYKVIEVEQNVNDTVNSINLEVGVSKKEELQYKKENEILLIEEL